MPATLSAGMPTEEHKNVRDILLHFPTSNAIENTQRCFVMYVVLSERGGGDITGGRKAERSVSCKKLTILGD